MQLRDQFLLSFRERGNRQAVDTGTALVLPDMFPGFGQIGPIIDLVDQRMDFPVPLLSSSSSANRRLRGSPPCRPHTPWCDGVEPQCLRPIVRARPCSVFGRPVHLLGLLPLIATRWFSSSLSDPTSRQAPCPPEIRRWWLQVGLSVSRLSPLCLSSLSIPSIFSGR